MQSARWVPIVVCLSCLISLPHSHAGGGQVENPPTLQASSLLPPPNTSGPNYSIDDTVVNDGFENRFVLKTNYGTFVVEGHESLKERVRELQVISRIEQLSQSDEFAKQFGNKLLAPVTTATNLLTKPGETVQGVFTGVGNFFDKVSAAATTQDPHQEKGLSALLGFDSAKRQIAFQLGADPYSRFQPLQDRLDQLAQTAVSARLTAGAILAVIPGAAGTAVGGLGTAGDIQSIIKDNTPAQLSKRNEQLLAKMAVPANLVTRFLMNPSFTPTEKTAIVEALRRLGNVQNRAEYIRRAADINDAGAAYFFYRRAPLTVAYHERVERAARFVTLGGVPVIQTASGKVVALFPIDHLAWTATADTIFRRMQADLKGAAVKVELWLGGTASELARERLGKHGWVVREKVGESLGGRS